MLLIVFGMQSKSGQTRWAKQDLTAADWLAHTQAAYQRYTSRNSTPQIYHYIDIIYSSATLLNTPKIILQIACDQANQSNQSKAGPQFDLD
jgi:hypothetical protein